MPKLRLPFIVFFSAAVAGGCAVLSESPVIRLWSQTQAVLPFVDRYNAQQNKFKIEAVYVPSPAEELLLSQSPPDLILSERLSSPNCAAKLENLGPILHRDGVDSSLFYQELLSLHQFQNTPVVLPFSFDLPVIVYRKDVFPKDPPALLSVDELRSKSRDFDFRAKNKTIALGFSPLLDQDFLFHSAALFNVNFQAAPGRSLAWDETALESWVRFMAGWCDEDHGGYARELDFVRTYLYEAPYQLLQDKIASDKKTPLYRISFYHALTRDVYYIPEAKRAGLGVSWLARSQKIPVHDAILFFGIPRGSRNRSGAYDFLKWAFTREAQKGILEENAKKNPLSFGIGNGFSSLVSINENELFRRIAFLKGRMPAENQLQFPAPLPETWGKLKSEALLPWMHDRFSRKSGAAALRERIK